MSLDVSKRRLDQNKKCIELSPSSDQAIVLLYDAMCNTPKTQMLWFGIGHAKPSYDRNLHAAVSAWTQILIRESDFEHV